jgi:hypothetical protein
MFLIPLSITEVTSKYASIFRASWLSSKGKLFQMVSVSVKLSASRLRKTVRRAKRMISRYLGEAAAT